MKETEEQLTLQQLEALAEAWTDCSLDRNEEKALRKVLAVSKLHSPVLDECRMAMGLETLMSRNRPRRFLKAGMWMSAAASLALIVVSSLAFSHHLAAREEVRVFVGGQRVSNPEDAREIVNRDMLETKAFVEETIKEMAALQNRQHEMIDLTFEDNVNL